MKNIKEAIRNIVKEESEYQTFFKKALEKSGKSITDMSDDEKKAFFNKIDAAWDGKGEKNEELVGNQHKLDVDGDGEIEASDLAALRAGKKKDESLTELTIPVLNKLKSDIDGLKVKNTSRRDFQGMVTAMVKNNTKGLNPKQLSAVEDALLQYWDGAPWKFSQHKIQIATSGVFATESKVNEAEFKVGDKIKHKKANTGTFVVLNTDNGIKVKNLNTGRVFNNLLNPTEYETINENFSPSDVEKIKKAVQNSASFMQIGRGLQQLGFKYSFGTSPYPIYMIKKGTKTYVLINKKYADDPEFVIGDTAGGLLEGVVTEGKFKSGDKVSISHPTMIKPVKGVVSMVVNASGNEVLVLKGDGGVWDAKFATLNESKFDRNFAKKIESIIKKELGVSELEVTGPFGSRFVGRETYLFSIPNPTHKIEVYKDDFGSMYPAKYYVALTNYYGHPYEETEVKNIKDEGTVLKTVSAIAKKYKKRLTYAGMGETKSVNEGNAFGAAVTAAKKEGKKEFEFNGKKYKVKKGSYEKNESAKKLAEKTQSVTKK